LLYRGSGWTFPFDPHGSEDLLFFGRIHPDNGAAEAITVAHRSGQRSIMAGIVQNQNYHDEEVARGVTGFLVDSHDAAVNAIDSSEDTFLDPIAASNL
jgi:hypothetical protein